MQRLFLAYIKAFSAPILISRHAKALIFYLSLSQDGKPYQTENLQKDNSSDVLITNESKISKGLIIPCFLILLMSCERQELFLIFH